MSKARLWYVKQAEAVKGPFPAAQLKRAVHLGRIGPETLLSEDGTSWRPLRDFPAFFDPERRVDLEQERMRLDERHDERRRDSDEAGPDRRNGPDRRQPESEPMIQARRRRTRIWHSLSPEPVNNRGAVLGIIGSIAAVVALGFMLSPNRDDFRSTAADCSALPGPNVVWDACDLGTVKLRGQNLAGASLQQARLPRSDLEGADLSGADLAYANLSAANLAYSRLEGARLTGANVSHADLRFARLGKADLSHADLRNANLQGADLAGVRLGGTLWFDGTRCARHSVGACLIQTVAASE